jgi:hypothetical protein
MLPSKSIAVTDMLLVPIEATHNTVPTRINQEMSTLLGKQAPRIPNKFFRKRLHGLAKIGARGQWRSYSIAPEWDIREENTLRDVL